MDEPPFDPEFDRPTQPPQDMAAEQAVLGAMMLSADVIPDVTQIITGADYWRPAHEAIHDAITDLHHRGDPVDMVTVGSELQRRGDLPKIGGADYLHTLVTGVHVAANAAYHAESIRDQARLRSVDAAASKLHQLVARGRVGMIDHYLGDALQVIEDATTRWGPRATTGTGLADLSWIRDGEPPPQPQPAWARRTDGTALFYPGKVNGIFGDPEAGKTWVAQCAGVEALNAGGTFAMIDVDHNGPNHTAARLLLLGATLDQLANPDLFRYYEPDDADQLRGAVDDITHRAPDVVLIDSLGEVFPMLGVSTNDGDEMSTAMRQVCTRPADAGSCVITIDHLPKSHDARATGFAIGSIAKKRMVRGAYLRAEARVQPAPGQRGLITLRIEKDTIGELRRSSGGGYAGTFTLDSRQPHITTWSIGREDTPTNEDGTTRPTHLMERISRYIEDNDQCSFRDIKDAVTGKDRWLRAALTLLVNEGFVSTIPGAHNARLHHSIALYREAEDDHQ